MSAPSNLRRAASHGGEPKVQGQSGTEAPPRTVKRTRPEDPAEDPGLEREECTRHSQADPRIRRVLAVGYETRIARGHCSEKGNTSQYNGRAYVRQNPRRRSVWSREALGVELIMVITSLEPNAKARCRPTPLAKVRSMQLRSRPFAKPAQVLHDQLRMCGAFASWKVRWRILHVTVEETTH